MRSIRRRPVPLLSIAILGLALTVIAGCDSSDPDPDWRDVAAVRISPDSVAISVGETADFSFALLNADGDEIEVDLNTRWESTDTTVFTVAENGLATAIATGSALCVIEVTNYPLSQISRKGAKTIEASGRAAGLGFTGRDSALVMVF